MVSLRDEKNSSHAQKTESWFLTGFFLKNFGEHPVLFTWKFPPGGLKLMNHK